MNVATYVALGEVAALDEEEAVRTRREMAVVYL